MKKYFSVVSSYYGQELIDKVKEAMPIECPDITDATMIEVATMNCLLEYLAFYEKNYPLKEQKPIDVVGAWNVLGRYTYESTPTDIPNATVSCIPEGALLLNVRALARGYVDINKCIDAYKQELKENMVCELFESDDEMIHVLYNAGLLYTNIEVKIAMLAI